MEEIIIDVIDVTDDGVITLECNEAGQNLLIQEGINSILKNHIAITEGENEKDTTDRACCSNVSCECGGEDIS